LRKEINYGIIRAGREAQMSGRWEVANKERQRDCGREQFMLEHTDECRNLSMEP
jgi:hypothetical protein